MSNITILVTGGAGYVGSHAVLDLLNSGYEVIVVDNLCNSYKSSDSLKPVSLLRVENLTGKSVTFYSVDIRNREELGKVFHKHKIDCVAHFAALKAVGESCVQPLTYYQNNITGSSILLEIMKEHNVNRILYSSSATVYGLPQQLPIPESHPTGIGCTNPYGKTKYFVEEMLKDLCLSENSWSIISLRYFNPVGAHESGMIGEDPNGEPNNLMPFISQVAVGRRENLTIYGTDYDTPDGTGVRDYIHITDLSNGHIKALEKLMEKDFKGFKAYNLGSGHGYSVLEVVKAFGEACGKSIPYVFGSRRAGDIDSSFADPTLANKELNWRAEKTLQDMCVDTWRWQKSNPNGFNNI